MEPNSVIEFMRDCVNRYDAFHARLEKLRNFRIVKFSPMEKKGGSKMKFGTVLAIILAVIALLGAGAAAAVYFSKKHCLLCNDKEDDLFDDFPDDTSDLEADAPLCDETSCEEIAE